jgi:hypothetical protein
MNTTSAKACRRLRRPLSFAPLALLAAAGCAVTLGSDAGKAPSPVSAPAPAQVVAEQKSPMCTVDQVVSSPGTLRCFFGQLRVCDSSGSWRAADSSDHPRASFGEACEIERDSVVKPTVPGTAGRSKR